MDLKRKKFEIWKIFLGVLSGFQGLILQGKRGVGVSNALIVRLSAVGLLARCLLLLLVLYLHLLYSVIWCLYMQGLRRLYYIVSIDTDNVYYVTRAFILKLLYNIPIFYFNRLNGHFKSASLNALCSKAFSRWSFDFLVSFCYFALLPACPAAAAFEACYVSIMPAAAAFAAFDMPVLYYLQGFTALCVFILAFLVRFCLKSCNI